MAQRTNAVKLTLTAAAIFATLTNHAALAGGNVVIVNSSIVGTQPFVTQGVEVQKGNTWYLGNRSGLTAHSIPGGMQFRQTPEHVTASQSAVKRAAHTSGEASAVKAAHEGPLHPIANKGESLTEKPGSTRDLHRLARRVQRMHDKLAYLLAHLPPLPKPACGTIYYRVLPGDSLGLIAERLLSDPADWRSIYAANKSLIGKNPSDLQVGMVLKIPQSKN